MPVQKGERRKIDGQLAEWDGDGWLAVESEAKSDGSSKAYMVPFKDGMRPATKEEFGRYKARSEDPRWQLADAAMASTLAVPMTIGAAGTGALGTTLRAGARVASGLGAVGSGVSAVKKTARGDISGAAQDAGMAGLLATGAGVPTRSLLARVLPMMRRAPKVPVAAPVAAPAAPAAAAPVAAAQPARTRVVGNEIFEAKPGGGWVKVGNAPPPAAPVAQAAGSTIEEQLRQNIKAVAANGKLPTPTPPKPPTILEQAQILEAKVVDLRARQGLSADQIANALKEQGHPKGDARKFVNFVLEKHGITRMK